MRKLEPTRYVGGDTTVYLTEAQWRGLLRRFNEEEIHKKRGGLFIISVPCMLCRDFARKRGSDCKGCPLKEAGCLFLLGKHGSDDLSIVTSCDRIEWGKERDKEVREGIRNIREVLLGLPRARRGK